RRPLGSGDPTDRFHEIVQYFGEPGEFGGRRRRGGPRPFGVGGGGFEIVEQFGYPWFAGHDRRGQQVGSAGEFGEYRVGAVQGLAHGAHQGVHGGGVELVHGPGHHAGGLGDGQRAVDIFRLQPLPVGYIRPRTGFRRELHVGFAERGQMLDGDDTVGG